MMDMRNSKKKRVIASAIAIVIVVAMVAGMVLMYL